MEPSGNKRTNHAQDEYLVEFMETNYNLLFGKDYKSPGFFKVKQEIWEKLTKVLNSKGMTKNANGWKKRWANLKHQTDFRWALIQGGGSKSETVDLSDLDKRIVRLTHNNVDDLDECHKSDGLQKDHSSSDNQETCAEVMRTLQGEYIFYCYQCQSFVGHYDKFVEHMNDFHSFNTDVDDPMAIRGTYNMNSSYISEYKDFIEDSSENIEIKSDSDKSHISEYEEYLEDYETIEITTENVDSSDAVDKEDEDWEDPLGQRITIEIESISNKKECSSEKLSSTLECSKCKRRFISKQKLMSHLQRHERHPNWLKFACPYNNCKSGYSTEERRQQHIANYHIEVQCDICAVKFGSNLYLKKHIATIHNKQLECDICHEFFGTRESIRSHMVRHSKAKNFLCTECGERFQYSATYIKHRLKHQGKVREKKRVCELCGAKYVSAFNLREHLDMHAGIRAQKCTKCDKAFFRRKDLRVHNKRIHSDIPPFECRHCTLRFRNPDTRKRHEKREHPDVDENSIFLVQ